MAIQVRITYGVRRNANAHASALDESLRWRGDYEPNRALTPPPTRSPRPLLRPTDAPVMPRTYAKDHGGLDTLPEPLHPRPHSLQICQAWDYTGAVLRHNAARTLQRPLPPERTDQ